MIPLELIDLICSNIEKKLLADICIINLDKNNPWNQPKYILNKEKNILFSLNKKRIEIVKRKYWKENDIKTLIRNNDIIGIRYLASINIKNVVFLGNLSWASQCGHLELVKYLVSLGADIHESDDCPMILAVRDGHLSIVKYFVEIGVNITIRNNTALTCACSWGNIVMVKYLVSIGADIVAQNKAIICASANGHLEIVKYLVSLGADPSTQDNKAVILASENGYLGDVKYLVSVGADITAQDNKALFLAKKYKHDNIVEFIESLNEIEKD